MADAWLATLDRVVATVPQGINPYEYVSEQLPNHIGVVGDADSSAFVVNISIIIAIYVFAFATTIFTLITKAKNGTCWLFRTRQTLRGTIVVPNTMTLFTVWSSIFTFFSALYCALLIAALKRQMTSVPAQSIMALIWQPMVLSLFSEGFGMVVALFLANPEVTFLNGRITLHANCVNIPAIAFYIITPAALIPYFALAAYKTARYLGFHAAFYIWLSAQINTWDGSSSFQWTVEGRDLVESMVLSFNEYVTNLANGFKIFAVLIAVAALCFVPAAFAYLQLLRTQMNSRRSFYSGSVASTASKHLAASGSTAASSRCSDRLESLTESYRLMVVETLLVMFTTLAYLVLNGWAGWFMDSIIGNAKAVIYQHLFFYWLFACFGTPVTCLIAYRTWKSYKSDSSDSRASQSSSGERFRKINVETQTVTLVGSVPNEKVFFLDRIPSNTKEGSIDKVPYNDVEAGSPA